MMTKTTTTKKFTGVKVLAVASLLAGAGVLGGMAWQPKVEVTKQPEKAAAPASGAYEIDAIHSSLLFRIKHMDTAYFYGRFDTFSGTLTLGDTLGLEATVKADSVNTNNAKRDQHVNSPDFFSSKEFPDITISAKDLKKTDAGFAGSANLTFRGVTKPVELSLTRTGAGKNRAGKDTIGFEGGFTIKRSDFGNKNMIGPLGDEVKIIISIEAGGK